MKITKAGTYRSEGKGVNEDDDMIKVTVNMLRRDFHELEHLAEKINRQHYVNKIVAEKDCFGEKYRHGGMGCTTCPVFNECRNAFKVREKRKIKQ